MNAKPAVLEFRGLQKDYGSTRALQPLDHRFEGGRIHALIGKNGSGKSTLIKMTAGAVAPSAGEILLDGRPLALRSPQDAFAAGIVTVHQELSLIPELSVAENIFLGRMPKAGAFIRWGRLNEMARRLLDDMGATGIDPAARVASLSVGRQQVVEIAKAMSYAPRVLQLDEPTSALARDEVDHLFALLRRLRDKGVLMIYVSHRLAELPEIADDIAVLRDGAFIGAVDIAQATPRTIVDMMFGQVEEFVRHDSHAHPSEVVLEVRNLKIEGLIEDVSFALRKGEVLGIAGMLGSGRTELLRGIFGADPVAGGQILVAGTPVERPSPRRMRALGVGYTSEDRKATGLVQILSCHANLCLAGLSRMAASGWTSERRERPYVLRQIEDLRIKLGAPELPVSSLSGGNQQKIVVGNWLNIGPRVLLFDEPSRGVDVQAKQQIFQMMFQLAQKGLAAIVVSTELEELPAVCDRILVLKNGRLSHEFGPDIGAKALYEACMADPS
ncbi:MAG: sugar ABC transporter ATP-binding protein [Burkholderiales bacterium]|nr:sugar ABC transporter ATP-binding protein [Burkholderiales bacterium]